MFDIGFWELVLIFIVGIIVLGPERLALTVRSILRFINHAKAMANGVKDDLSSELKIRELEEQLKDTKAKAESQLKLNLDSSTNTFNQTTQIVEKTVNSVDKEMENYSTSSFSAVNDIIGNSTKSEKSDNGLK